jgi:uncharacterized Tic20 family protein
MQAAAQSQLATNGDPESLVADIQAAQPARRPRSERSLEALVDDYEEASERLRLGADGEIEYVPKRKPPPPPEKPKRGGPAQQLWVEDEADRGQYNYEEMVVVPSSQEERNISAVMHAMPLLMVIFGMLTAGIGVPIMLLITFGVYMSYKDRSEFVRQNALAALKNQLFGTFGWFATLTLLPIIATVLMVVLAITIIGILLIPFVVIGLVGGILASLLMPAAMVVNGAVGAWQSYHGEVYKYPYRRWFGRARRRMPKNVGPMRFSA